jgi:hypothetical protein
VKRRSIAAAAALAVVPFLALIPAAPAQAQQLPGAYCQHYKEWCIEYYWSTPAHTGNPVGYDEWNYCNPENPIETTWGTLSGYPTIVVDTNC